MMRVRSRARPTVDVHKLMPDKLHALCVFHSCRCSCAEKARLVSNMYLQRYLVYGIFRILRTALCLCNRISAL